ncbi:hypothetical protein QYE76_024140 [Lolium multiflorum]|uniref:RNase H type-1 domain-containing protein n=1 Tax=Lolium multiflorum TaxID=4521 RepID=A0AAD8RBJ2_LOLMU|nr:hypothetical protein QYE76_024140 [Lolium multiflorum]
MGWTKLNADGAFSAKDGSGGCGVVMRDHNGRFLVGASHFFHSSSDPERAELLACKQALVMARSKGLTKMVLETDCLGVVAKIRSNNMDRSIHGPLVEEIKSLLKDFADHSVRHVRRTGNKVAHSLARFGCENKCYGSGQAPPWIAPPPAHHCEIHLCLLRASLQRAGERRTRRAPPPRRHDSTCATQKNPHAKGNRWAVPSPLAVFDSQVWPPPPGSSPHARTAREQAAAAASRRDLDLPLTRKKVASGAALAQAAREVRCG